METLHKTSISQDKQLFLETTIVMGITIVLSFLFQELKGIITLIPAVYFLVERRVRKRTWSDIGFKLNQTLSDIIANWKLIVLAAVILQVLTLLYAQYLLPGYVQHVLSRIPTESNVFLVLIFFVPAATFLEELIFRAFFQERLSWFMSIPLAIVITSAVFALLHFSSGSASIVSFDLLTIFVDGVVYGIIYHRTKNIFASWIPHFLADFVGITLMMSLYS